MQDDYYFTQGINQPFKEDVHTYTFTWSQKKDGEEKWERKYFTFKGTSSFVKNLNEQMLLPQFAMLLTDYKFKDWSITFGLPYIQANT